MGAFMRLEGQTATTTKKGRCGLFVCGLGATHKMYL